MTAGQGATSDAIALEVALRRRICLTFPHPAAHGLLSLISLLRAFLLHATKRNQAYSSVGGEAGKRQESGAAAGLAWAALLKDGASFFH